MSCDYETDDLEWQYNPRASVVDVDDYLARGSRLSAAARRHHRAVIDVAYGRDSNTTLDIFPAGAEAPVHVFVHGGYWRGLDKSDYSFVADALVPAGITTVVMNYDLCPVVSLPEIMAQTRAAMRWIYAHAGAFGICTAPEDLFASHDDTPPISFSGHSAGAHLIAIALAADSGEEVLPAGRSPVCVLISGIYDLEPVLAISVNEEIQLRPEQVEPMSPMRHPMRPDLPVQVVVGGDEPTKWIEESSRFAKVCRDNGSCCSYREIEGHHHFSITTLFETPAGALARIIRDTVTASC